MNESPAVLLPRLTTEQVNEAIRNSGYTDCDMLTAACSHTLKDGAEAVYNCTFEDDHMGGISTCRIHVRWNYDKECFVMDWAFDTRTAEESVVA